MKLHVLSGDALVETFRTSGIEGNTVICRECLIVGDLPTDNLWNFWRARAAYISSTYSCSPDLYYRNVVSELLQIVRGNSDEINLWFEYDLFCQVNLWFILSLLTKIPHKRIYRVFPFVRSHDEIWKGFGGLSGMELKECFMKRERLSFEDVQFGEQLWKAYANTDVPKLKTLGSKTIKSFPYLKEACQAEIERKQNRRPEKTLQAILENETDFAKIFARFQEMEGVFGFGDSQVKVIMEEITAKK